MRRIWAWIEICAELDLTRYLFNYNRDFVPVAEPSRSSRFAKIGHDSVKVCP